MRTGSLAPILEIPQPVDRPPWALWLWRRRIDYRGAGRAVGRSHEWVRTTCLPFDDPRRTVPDAQDAARIFDYTAGEITPESFQAPQTIGSVA